MYELRFLYYRKPRLICNLLMFSDCRPRKVCCEHMVNGVSVTAAIIRYYIHTSWYIQVFKIKGIKIQYYKESMDK